jgi:hypothetical protein
MNLSLDMGRAPAAPDRSVALAGRISLAYIMACTHSGSTLLAMQLARQPGVCSVGELSGTRHRARPGYRCSCGAELVHCDFWRRVAAAMAKRGFSFDPRTAETDVRNAPSRYARRLLRPMHRGRLLELVRDAGLSLSPGARQYLRRHQALKTALAESVLECSGESVLVDSSKLGVQLKYQLRNPRFDVKVIWLVRDGRAVACSLMRNQKMTMAQAAYQWRRFYEEADAILRRLDAGQWRQVRYEELCAEPERTLGPLWQFVGMPREIPEGAHKEFHVLGHDTRLNMGKARPNEKWRKELTAADLQVFEQVAGRLNRQLGYT